MIVGDGEESSALQRLIRELGLQDRVDLIGYQENPAKFMARASILALPSLTEGFPNVIGEALALGLPVVAADCSPGVREYLCEGRCGLLVPPKDVGQLAHGLTSLLRDPALRQQFREDGLRWSQSFALHKVIGDFETEVTRIVDGSTRH